MARIGAPGFRPLLLEEFLDDFGALERLRAGSLEARALLALCPRRLAHLQAQLGALVQRNQASGKLGLQHIELRCQHGLCGQYMPDMAAILQQCPILLPAHCTAAFRTGERRRSVEPVILAHASTLRVRSEGDVLIANSSASLASSSGISASLTR